LARRPHALGREKYGIDDSQMRAATAKMAVQRRNHIAARRVGIAIEERFCADNYPGKAIAALSGLELK
jgi:hypothetical protein